MAPLLSLLLRRKSVTVKELIKQLCNEEDETEDTEYFKAFKLTKDGDLDLSIDKPAKDK